MKNEKWKMEMTTESPTIIIDVNDSFGIFSSAAFCVQYFLFHLASGRAYRAVFQLFVKRK